jgi:hypothetical protein
MADWRSDHGELPKQRESRLAMCACLNADVIYRGVRDGLCYYEVYFSDEAEGPKAVLSIPTDALTAEKISEHAATADVDIDAEPELGEWRCPNGHNSAIRPRLPEVMFHACGHYRPTVVTWNEYCITCCVRHAPFRIYWHSYRVDSLMYNPKNYCGYCGARMVNLRAAR